MTPNIDAFFNMVPNVIIHRGKNYFEDGAVFNCLEVKPNYWEAFVRGNYGNYKVKISISENSEVENFYCNCPFDGFVSKHMVATLFEIEQQIQNYSDPKIQMESAKIKAEWIQIIDTLAIEELKLFVKKYASANQKFRDELMVNYKKVSNELNIDYYANTISNILNKYDYDYLDYNDVYDFGADIDPLITDANIYFEKKNYYEAFSIYAAISSGLIAIIENIDDSNGIIGNLIQESIYGIDKILDKIEGNKLYKEIYSWLKNEIKNDDYYNYGLGELEDLFYKYTKTEKQVSDLIKTIDKKIKSLENEEDSWYTKNNKERLVKRKLQLYINTNQTKKANKLINDFIYIVEFRQKRIDESLRENNFDRAIKEIKDAITTAVKKDDPRTIHNWEDQLLEIYQKTNNIKKVNALSLKLFKTNTGNLNYYKIFKKTVEKNNWISERSKILKFLKSEKPKHYFTQFSSNNYADFLVAEKMWKELFTELKQNTNISDLIRYSKYLKTNYSKELMPLYLKEIRKIAKGTGRDTYIEIVGYLKELANLNGGLIYARNLKNELLETYHNRPAMKDEFSRLEF